MKDSKASTRSIYSKKVNRWMIPALALLIVSAGIFIGFSKRPQLATKGVEPSLAHEAVKTPANEQEALAQVATAQTRHFKGDPDAPVTILEFSDFQ